MALVAFAAVMIWGGSGLLHPLMTWTNPRAVTFMPPPVSAGQMPEADFIRQAVTRFAPQGFSGLRLVEGGVQLTLPDAGERLYIGRDGRLRADADREYAIKVARHYTGLEQAQVVESTLITSFSNQYTYINRYLPVWKVTFDDPRGISVYVDTATDRLGAITDRRKVILQTLFQVLHTGQWLDAVEPVRLVLIGGLVGLVLSVSIAGLYMLVRLRGPRRGLRRVHRLMAYAGLLPLLMFPVSGLFHLMVQSPLVYPQGAEAPVLFTPDDLAFWPARAADDMRLVPPGWWRVQRGDEVRYTRLSDGKSVAGDEAFVRALRGIEDQAVAVTLVTGFTDEYGFAYKRLPVWRVAAGDDVLFIEARTGVVAAHVNPVKKAEGWVFSRLHKWQFLDPLSAQISGTGPFKTAFRDGVMVLFVSLALVLAVLGFFIRRKGAAKPRGKI